MNPYCFVRKVLTKLRFQAIYHLQIKPLLRTVAPNAEILEIGGGYNPQFAKKNYKNVYHLDHCSTEELKAKYLHEPLVAHLVDRIPHVDFISTNTSNRCLIPDELRFDVVYSSHALEHQVDLIEHFNFIAEVLKPDGKAIMIIPDNRACFDAFRFPTVTSDVIPTHRNGSTIHQGKQIFEARAQRIDFNASWPINRIDNIPARFTNSLSSAYQEMLHCERNPSEYVDAHAWTFNPTSFELLLTELYLLELTCLLPCFISKRYGNQFCAVLTAQPEKSPINQSQLRCSLNRRRIHLSKKLYC